jgi:hypothetical protein
MPSAIPPVWRAEMGKFFLKSAALAPMVWVETVHSLNDHDTERSLVFGCLLVGSTDQSVTEPPDDVKRKTNVDAEAQALEPVISMARSRTYLVRERTDAVRGMPPAYIDGCRSEAVLHPGATHKPQAPDDTAAPDETATPVNPYAMTQRYPFDSEGLDVAFAGGRVEISAEAMARNMVLETTSDPLSFEARGAAAAPLEADTDDSDERNSDSSPDNGQVAPGLGERVL